MPPLCRNGFINEEGDVTCTTCITKRYIVEDGLCKGKCNLYLCIFFYLFTIFILQNIHKSVLLFLVAQQL